MSAPPGRDDTEELLRGAYLALLALAGAIAVTGPILCRAAGTAVSALGDRIGLSERATLAVVATIATAVGSLVAITIPAPDWGIGFGAAAASLVIWGAADRRRGRPFIPTPLARASGRRRAHRGRDPEGPARRADMTAPGRASRRRLSALRADPALWAPGFDGSGRPLSLAVADAVGHHALVIGATGSGKTTLLRDLARAWVADPARGALVAIDCKGDEADFARPLAAIAAGASRPGRVWGRSVPDFSIDPFSDGTPAERVGRIVEAYVWSEEHYRATAAAYLRDALDALDAEGAAADIHTLAAAVARPADHSVALTARWAAEGREGERVRVGLAARLRAWAESEGAERARTGGVRLSTLLADDGLTALSMPAAADPAQVARWAQLLARGCLQAAAGRSLPRPALLIIDEAQFAGGPALSAILQQGRGLGLYVVLAFQEAETAYATLGPAWANPQTIIVGRQGDRESAERAAWLFGTRRERLPRWGIEAAGLGTERYSDVGSEQWQDVMAVNPQAIRELGPGRFFLVSRGSRPAPQLVVVSAPSPAPD